MVHMNPDQWPTHRSGNTTVPLDWSTYVSCFFWVSFYRNSGRMWIVCFPGKHIRMLVESSQLPYNCLLFLVELTAVLSVVVLSHFLQKWFFFNQSWPSWIVQICYRENIGGSGRIWTSQMKLRRFEDSYVLHSFFCCCFLRSYKDVCLHLAWALAS